MDRKELRKKRKLLKLTVESQLLANKGKELPSVEIEQTSSNIEVELLSRKKECLKATKAKFYSKLNSGESIDLQAAYQLIIYSIFGRQQPRWCSLLSRRSISQSTLVIVDAENCTPTNYPYLYGNFQHCVSVCPSKQSLEDDHFYDGLVRVCSSLSDFSDPNGHRLPETITKPNLLLSAEDMLEEDVPLPTALLRKLAASTDGCSNDADNGDDCFYSRPNYAVPSLDSPVFAIDCEMCLSGPDQQELTRISVVDEKYRVVIDELVKPERPIIDYLTQYSGITEEMLSRARCSFSDIHQMISRLIPPDGILCGHTIRSDLKALRLFHPFNIDISLLYNLTGRQNTKTALRKLTYTFLNGMEIQNSRQGHCSVEDAYATMALLKLKLDHFQEPQFGNLACGFDLVTYLSSSTDPAISDAVADSSSSKRPRLDSNQTGDTDAPKRAPVSVCEACGKNVEYNCNNKTCRCRQLTRIRCRTCYVGDKNQQDKLEAIDANVHVEKMFKTLTEKGALMKYRVPISTLLTQNKKKLLWIGISHDGTLFDDVRSCKKAKLIDVEQQSTNDSNRECLRQYQSHLYQYDMNIVEFRDLSEKKVAPNTDRQVESPSKIDQLISSVYEYTSGKSLVCVLVGDRSRNGNSSDCAREFKLFVKLKP